MPRDTDAKFYDRADAHIHLSNEQIAGSTRGKVSASMMYATARFNAWISARGFKSGEEMAREKEAIIKYFTDQYRLMLDENFDDYVAEFEQYMQPGRD